MTAISCTGRRRLVFTMVEVIVAMAILTLSLGALLQMVTQARSRMVRTYDKWRQMHMLTQGAEYVLLHSQSVDSVPLEYFPWNDYRIAVSYSDAEGLPEQESAPAGQLPLEACKIELIDARNGQTVDSLTVDRIHYDNALEESD